MYIHDFQIISRDDGHEDSVNDSINCSFGIPSAEYALYGEIHAPVAAATLDILA